MGHYRYAAALAAFLAPAAGHAQPVSGLYIATGIGANFMQNQPVERFSLNGADTLQFRSARFDPGFAAVASIGWGLGNGLRLELEGSYRQNDINAIRGAATSGGSEQKYGAMFNAVYDFDFGWPIVPYVGLGIGEQTVNVHNGRAAGPGYFIRLQHEDMTFAYQAILGGSYALPVPGLALTAEYRFLGISGHTVYGQYFAPGLAQPAEARFNDDFNHSVLVGLRYAFNAAPPPVVVQATPAPAVAAARTYLVFFDWDRADLTDRARQIIAEAAQATTRVQVTRLMVAGHADRSGTPRYNQGLSVRRAQNVAAELVRLGVPRQAITVQGFGDTRPLVPTAAGVREPQNRRVEIVLQ